MVDTLIKEAVAKKDWVDIGMLSEESKVDSASYRSYEREVSIEEGTFRAAVIHSDFYDKRKKKSIDKKIVKDLEEAKAVKKKLTAIQYYCQKDAKVAAEKVKPPKYHKLNIAVEEKRYTKKEDPETGKNRWQIPATLLSVIYPPMIN